MFVHGKQATAWAALTEELDDHVAPASELGIVLLQSDESVPTHFRFPHRTLAELMLAWGTVRELLKLLNEAKWEGEANALGPLLQMLEGPAGPREQDQEAAGAEPADQGAAGAEPGDQGGQSLLSVVREKAPSAIDEEMDAGSVQWRFVTGMISRLTAAEPGDRSTESRSFRLLQVWLQCLSEKLRTVRLEDPSKRVEGFVHHLNEATSGKAGDRTLFQLLGTGDTSSIDRLIPDLWCAAFVSGYVGLSKLLENVYAEHNSPPTDAAAGDAGSAPAQFWSLPCLVKSYQTPLLTLLKHATGTQLEKRGTLELLVSTRARDGRDEDAPDRWTTLDLLRAVALNRDVQAVKHTISELHEYQSSDLAS